MIYTASLKHMITEGNYNVFENSEYYAYRFCHYDSSKKKNTADKLVFVSKGIYCTPTDIYVIEIMLTVP